MADFQVVDNSNLKEVSFATALTFYLSGRTIECRIIEDGMLVDWEKYHILEGLDIALEFDEIINGKWYVEIEIL